MIMDDDFAADIERCLQTLRSGGTILYPTDTVWGIGCDATDQVAVEKIYQLKKRDPQKSCLLLLADMTDLLKYVTALDLSVFDYIEKATKPLTIIYDNVIGVADNLLAQDGSIGFRIVQEPFCKNLIKRLRKPLVSTSANLSGQPTPLNFATIDPHLKAGVDYTVQYRQKDSNSGTPSTIIKWNDDGNHVVLRS